MYTVYTFYPRIFVKDFDMILTIPKLEIFAQYEIT